jgi:hypothetical protein
MRARKTRAGPESDRDAQLASAALPVTQLHTRNPPGIRQPQGGGEQQRGIHTPKLPASHLHPTSPPTPNSEKPNSFIQRCYIRRRESSVTGESKQLGFPMLTTSIDYFKKLVILPLLSYNFSDTLIVGERDLFMHNTPLDLSHIQHPI